MEEIGKRVCNRDQENKKENPVFLFEKCQEKN